jgi:hypothetical protein
MDHHRSPHDLSAVPVAVLPPGVVPKLVNSDRKRLVSEVIALELRRPHSSHEYLYPQRFSGISYLVACLCMAELARVLRKRRKPTDVTLPLSESTLMNRNDV